MHLFSCLVYVIFQIYRAPSIIMTCTGLRVIVDITVVRYYVRKSAVYVWVFFTIYFRGLDWKSWGALFRWIHLFLHGTHRSFRSVLRYVQIVH